MADTCQIRKNNGLSAIFMVKCASLMFFVLVALVFWVLVAIASNILSPCLLVFLSTCTLLFLYGIVMKSLEKCKICYTFVKTTV